MAKVIIGCRLPHGLVLSHPLEPGVKVTIAGMNSSKIIGATHVTTEIDADLWDAWKIIHKDFKPFVSGAIFEAKSEADATAKAKELKKEKTGFERLAPDAHGVQPANKEA